MDLTGPVENAARRLAEMNGRRWDDLTALEKHEMREGLTPLIASAFEGVNPIDLITA